MSITVSNLGYRFADRQMLFNGLSFHVARGEKASLTGDNGSGKSTILKLIASQTGPFTGRISVMGSLYFIPQHFGQWDTSTIGQALGIDAQTSALRAILSGSTDQKDFDILGDHWDIEQRVARSLDKWGLGNFSADTPMKNLSGGEKTRVFLSGIDLHSPGVILMDEPTNHLDHKYREIVYEILRYSQATILLVSHDRRLLDLAEVTYELTAAGISRYGGNYTFYRRINDEHLAARQSLLESRMKEIRHTETVARKAEQRKRKADARGEKKQKRAGVPRIMMGGLKDNAEKSSSSLNSSLSVKIEKQKEEAARISGEILQTRNLEVKLTNPLVHKGKLLVSARDINYCHLPSKPLWTSALSFDIFSGERIRIEGDNGSGKTTLLNLLTGSAEPSEGTLYRAWSGFVCLDQEYSLIDDSLTVIEQLEKHNKRKLPESFLRTELTRMLFGRNTWDKKCGYLSGGERLRLALCCLSVSSDTPQAFILDEPTNNLDIRGMEVLEKAIGSFEGTVIAITHDRNFAGHIRLDRSIRLRR